MRAANGKYLALAAVVSLMLPGFVSDTSAATINANAAATGSATVNVTAQISFARDITVGMESDVTFGDVLAPYGGHSVITIGDSRGQILNFLSGNYRPGGGISSLHARCVLKGVENVDCEARPVSGERENTLFIGVDMRLEDGRAPVDNKTIPSFDMSIVYQ